MNKNKREKNTSSKCHSLDCDDYSEFYILHMLTVISTTIILVTFFASIQIMF